MRKSLLFVLLSGLLIGLCACGVVQNVPGLGPSAPKEEDYLYRIVQNGKWGFINQQGQVVIEPFIRSPEDSETIMRKLHIPLSTYEVKGETITIYGRFLDNPTMLKKVDDLQSFDIFGFHYDYLANNVVLNRKRLPVDKFSEGLDSVLIDGKWGFIDRTGKIAIEPKYQGAMPFSDGFALVLENGRWKFIDPTGTPKFDRDFEEAYPFHEGYARFRDGEKWSYLYKSGDVLLESQMAWTGDFSEGLAIAKIEGRTAYIDPQGNTVIQANFQKGGSFQDGVAPVQEVGSGKWGYIDKTGTWIVPAQYDDAELFYGKHGAILQERAWGFVNEAGVLVVPPKYNTVGRFSEGLAPVKLDGKWGYVDESGLMSIEPQYEWAYSFDHGLAAVETAEGLGYINPKGEFVWKPSK